MRWLYDYFNFSRGEKLGFWVLACLLLFLMILPKFIPTISTPVYEEHDVRFKKELAQFLSSNDEQAVAETGKTENFKQELFLFNPNKIQYKDWLRLGLEPKIAHTIENYKEAGGFFAKASDLKNIYGMKDSVYHQLKPYVRISQRSKVNYSRNIGEEKSLKENTKPASSFDTKTKSGKKDFKPRVIIPVNSADSLSLLKVHGIGSFFASRIQKYRERLGGFYSKSQLLEIYAFDSSNLEMVKDQIRIDTSGIRKLSLSKSTFKQFLRHPYLDYASVKAIFRYKDNQDKSISIKDLKEDRIIGAKLYARIKPYLKP